MPLTEILAQARFGSNGIAGSHGSNAPTAATDGDAGGAGGRGGTAVVAANGVTRTGNLAAELDEFTVNLLAYGGHGNQAGSGGSGAYDSPIIVDSVVGDWQYRVGSHVPGSDGGDGGAGGSGGAAAARITNVSATAIDRVALQVVATGGDAGSGGSGGAGGRGGETGQVIDVWANSQMNQIGARGGDGGAAGAGGVGGNGSAIFSLLSMTNVDDLLITASVSGGRGAHGGVGGESGGGIPTGMAMPGGQGGRGGSATFQLNGLGFQETQERDSSVFIDGHALGGTGGLGRNAGIAGTALRFDETRLSPNIFDSTRTGWQTEDQGPGAIGGAGGAGGNATAELRNSQFAMGGGRDHVTVKLLAEGASGCTGGQGTPSLDDASYTQHGMTYTVTGNTPAANGADGADGRGSVIVMANSFAMGSGDDVLRFDLDATGTTRMLTFRSNTLEGGEGFDTLDFSGTGWGATFDLGRGYLTIAGGRNVMTGFERILGTDGADLFIDGAGSHVYSGGAGADHFRFGRTHGHDTIEAFTAQDVIEFSRIGARMDGFPDVLARSVNTASGVVIDTGYGGSLTLVGWQRDMLTADLFAFS